MGFEDIKNTNLKDLCQTEDKPTKKTFVVSIRRQISS